MSEDLGTTPTPEDEMRGADPPGRTAEGSERQREREGRTGSGEPDVVDVGDVDETGAARDRSGEPAERAAPGDPSGEPS